MENERSTPVAQKECTFCSELIAANAKKCKHCGEIIDPTLREVENLKNQRQNGPIIVSNNNNNNNNNNSGGTNITQPGIMMNAPKSRMTYILLAIFLGSAGIHNFYAGYAGRGIIQLILSCTMIGLVIVIPWIIFDIISVNRDVRGVEFI